MIALPHQQLNASKKCLSTANGFCGNAPLPSNEAARLEALYQCKILDTPPEKEFDAIAQLAALICGTPIASISLIDSKRQWFKSKVGWNVDSTPRNISLCAYTIRQQDVFIIPNTLADEKFAKNPLVTSHPHIHFYAGVPLITFDNQALGTLCVIDRVPRELNPQQIEALRTLGRSVVKLLELRRQATKVKSIESKQQSGYRHFFTRMAAGFGLASTILLGVGLVSYRSLTNLVHNDNWQIQHYQVIEDLKDLHSLIEKATIAKRYLTTKTSYLEPYNDVEKEIYLKIAFLKQETINNPHQQSQLATLKRLIKRNLFEIEQTTKSKTHKGVVSHTQLPQPKQANEIEAMLSQIERTENALLQQRSQAELAKTHNSILTLCAGICLNFLILAGVYYLTYREIRDRQHTEAALSQQRDFTDAILDTVGTLVVVLDPQGRIIRFNSACEQTTGYSFESVKGKYFWQLFSQPTEADIVKTHWEQLIASHDNSYENNWLTRDGDRRRIAWSNTTLRDRTGAVEVAIASGIDITEHSKAEAALRSNEQHLRNILNSLFTFVAVLTPDGTLIQANQALLEAAALKPEDVLGKHLTEAYWWCYSSTVQAQMQTAIEQVSQGDKVRYEVEGRVSDNQFINIDFALTPMFDSAGKVSYLIASGIDVTERKQAEAARQQANEQLSGRVNELKQRNREMTLLSEMSDFLQACLTVEEACTTLAQLVQPLFPGASGGIYLINGDKNLVEPVASWGIPLTADLKSFTPTDCWELRQSKPHWVDDTDKGLLCKHSHHSLLTESLCVPMMAQGKALGVLYLSSQETGSLTAAKQQLATTVAKHIALALANLKLRETLQNQSVRDPLTGLYNRRYMEESLVREMRRCDRTLQPMSIIMIDVDRFKHFNDTFGHNAGDAVLRELGQFLQKYVRGSDIACRYGGEEFILIIPEASLEVTWQRAEQIRTAVKQLNVECNGHSVGAISLSMGVASFPTHGLDPETVIKAADEALYRAKKSGRDRAIVASYSKARGEYK